MNFNFPGNSFAVLGTLFTVLLALFFKLIFLLLPFILLYYLLVILPRRYQGSRREYNQQEYDRYKYNRYTRPASADRWRAGDDLDLNIPPDQPLPGPWSRPQRLPRPGDKEITVQLPGEREEWEKSEEIMQEELKEIKEELREKQEQAQRIYRRKENGILPPERCQAPAAGCHWLWQRQGLLAGLIWAEVLQRRGGRRYRSYFY